MVAGRDPRALGGAWAQHQRHGSAAPAAALAGWVERYWWASWDYPEPYRQLVVPYPQVHLTFQDGRGRVQGVCTGHQVRELVGRGAVFGVAFRPGAFRPFLGGPVSALTDRVVDAAGSLRGPWPDPPTPEAVDAFLLDRAPEPDPRAEQAVAAVRLVAEDRGLHRVDDLAARLGSGVRQVQRLFAEHVGVGPKWTIRRYRLHEVTERLDRGETVDWAALAADLGFADQAHLVRDFRSIFGEPPTRYAERY